MTGLNELPKGYCRAHGGEASFASTASYCREVNNCTAADCPLENGGRREDADLAVKVLGSALAMPFLMRDAQRRR
jgi:hypothetical protein